MLFDVVDRNDVDAFEFKGSRSDDVVYQDLTSTIVSLPFDRRFRATVNSDVQFQMAAKLLDARLVGAGYHKYADNGFYSQINLVRSIQVSYAVGPSIDVGAMFSLFGENLANYFYDISDIEFYHTTEQNAASGYFLTGAYRIPIGRLKSIDASLGAGLGIAHLSYTSNGFHRHGEPYVDDSDVATVAKTVPAAVFFAHVNVYTHEALTLGIHADYIITGGLPLPAQPGIAIPAASIGFGNASAGISIGWSF